MDITTMNKRYTTPGYVFHDPESKFTLDLSGFGFYNTELVESYKQKLEAAYTLINRIEAGEIVNTSPIKEHSEDRQIDHFNLRLKNSSAIPSASYEQSIAQWREIKNDLAGFVDGSIVSPETGKKFTDVVLNGIGGSYLGPLMLILSQYYESYNQDKRVPIRIHTLANTDPDRFAALLSCLDLDTTVFVHISKSGSTAETRANMLTVQHTLEEAGLDQSHRCAVVTVGGSPLDQHASSSGWKHIFHMNESTGGRTSIASAVGMVPCAFAGIDFEDFLAGMSHMDTLTRRENALSNPAAMVSMAIDAQIAATGHKNVIFLAYADSMIQFSHYLQQLYMESLGKNYDYDGVECRTGLSLFGGVGTGEQHAFMQQVQKGIDDCIVRFITFRERATDYEIHAPGADRSQAAPTTMGRQFLGFYSGTQEALNANGRHYISTVYQRASPFNVGMAVALEERIVVMLASFWRINFADQPGVQDGKLAAKGIEAAMRKVCELLCTEYKVSGSEISAIEIHEKLNGCVNLSTVDMILGDIAANKASYSKELGVMKLEQHWQDGVGFKYIVSL